MNQVTKMRELLRKPNKTSRDVRTLKNYFGPATPEQIAYRKRLLGAGLSFLSHSPGMTDKEALEIVEGVEFQRTMDMHRDCYRPRRHLSRFNFHPN